MELPAPARVSALEASPDGRWLAIGTAFGDVFVADAASGALSRLVSIGEGSVEQLAWSADSQWLAWSEPVTSFGTRSKLRIAKPNGDATDIIDITDGRFCDESPHFTPDGKFLAFLSNRSFDPVYDGHSFDLSFPSPIKPYLVALAADTPSPFGPSIDTLEDDPADAGKNDDGDAPVVRVDAEGLAHRVIAVPVPQGNYSALTAGEGSLLWLDTELSGVTGEGKGTLQDKKPAPALIRYDLAKRQETTLVKAADRYRLSGDRQRIVYVLDQQVTSVPADKKVDEESGDLVKVELNRIRVILDPVAAWGQAFDEAWRLQRDFFWAPDMAGQDWESVHRRYRPIVERLGSHDDLVDLLWEIHGELGTSHAYVKPAAVSEPGRNGQGRLGAEFQLGEHGWEITAILAGESSDPLATSPLTRPGADAKVGDVLLAIDGVGLSAAVTPAMQLVGAAGRTVELTLVNGPGHGIAAGVQRRVAVVPVRDEEQLRYQDWVRGNRRTVREASGGKFGYLHVPDMMANGWAQLHRDLDTETALDGLIVDVRRNRGGHTSQLVAELIGRKVTGWSMPRGEKPRTYPHHAPRGPVVILADEFAGSDGDIITQVSKLRGIGPVIGTRTWGGVVGIDNRFALADGTGVTQPRYATWFGGGIGWDVENRGVEPDIEVLFPPHAYAAGIDPQLEYGIGALKEMIQELPTDRPPLREATGASGQARCRPAPRPARNTGKALHFFKCRAFPVLPDGLFRKGCPQADSPWGKLAGLGGEGGIQGDVDARERAGHGAAGLGFLRDTAELFFGDAGDTGAHGQVAARDAGTRNEGHVRFGLDFFRSVTGSGQGVAECHGEARRVGRCNKFFGAGLAAGLFGAGLPGDVERAESRAVQRGVAGALHQVAVPDGVCGAYCCHIHSLGSCEPAPAFAGCHRVQSYGFGGGRARTFRCQWIVTPGQQAAGQNTAALPWAGRLLTGVGAWRDWDVQ